MDQPDLRALLEHLHQELAANPPTDDRLHEVLLKLQRDIERALTPAGSATPAPEPADWRGRLQEAIAGFEGAHPQSTAALERVMTLLSNFGL